MSADGRVHRSVNIQSIYSFSDYIHTKKKICKKKYICEGESNDWWEHLFPEMRSSHIFWRKAKNWRKKCRVSVLMLFYLLLTTI